MRIPITFLLLHLLISTISPAVYGQDRYVHLMGSFGNGDPVSADFVLSGEKVSGFLHNGLPKPVAVYGELLSGDSIQLSVKSSDKTSISATLSPDGQMAGTWTENGVSRSFQLSEAYPPGSLKFQVQSVSSIQPLTEAPGSPFAVFESRILNPDDNMQQAATENFMSLIYSRLFRSSPEKDPLKLLQKQQTAFFDQYRAKNIDINTKENYPLLNWEKRLLMNVIFNASDVVSFQIKDYTYTGGGSSLEITRYLVIDASNGTQIQLSDFVTADYQSELRKRIRDEICRDLYMQPTVLLTDYGFFSDDVASSDNFFITSTGVGFHYNTYELAGQETGAVSVFLSFDKLEGLLMESNIVKRVVLN